MHSYESRSLCDLSCITHYMAVYKRSNNHQTINVILNFFHLSQRFFQSSKHFWNALFDIANSFCFDFPFSSSVVAKCFPFIGVFSLLQGRGKGQGGTSPMNMVVELWLRFCFWSKTHAQALMWKLVRYYGAKFMTGFSTILCVSDELLCAIGARC